MFEDPEIDGVENVSVRFEGERVDVRLEEFVEEGGRRGYRDMYASFLGGFSSGFEGILRRIVEMDGKGGMGKEMGKQAVLFHCTGKFK